MFPMLSWTMVPISPDQLLWYTCSRNSGPYTSDITQEPLTRIKSCVSLNQHEVGLFRPSCDQGKIAFSLLQAPVTVLRTSIWWTPITHFSYVSGFRLSFTSHGSFTRCASIPLARFLGHRWLECLASGAGCQTLRVEDMTVYIRLIANMVCSEERRHYLLGSGR